MSKELIRKEEKQEKEVKQGHWMDVGSLSCRCSECGGLALVDEDGNEQLTDFCPNCGSYNGGDNIGNE